MKRLQRAELLINQSRYDQAIEQLNQFLADVPEHGLALAYLALCQLNIDEPKEAITTAKMALAADPELDFALYVIALAHIKLENYQKALNAVNKAIGLNPDEAEYYGVSAQVNLIRRDFKESAEAAEKGLLIDPESLLCRNVLSTAQLKLGDKEASFKTIEKALELDPEHVMSHANYGWAELEKGSHKKAMEHFKEALRKNPNNSYARAGMLESLKARYFLYRMFLKYYFFIGNLKPNVQWAIIIGIVVINKIIRNGANNLGEYGVLLEYLSYGLIFFMISTWVIEPVFNFFMRLNTYSKYLLTPEESKTSVFVGICFTVFLISIFGWIFVPSDGFIAGTLVGFSLILPVGRLYEAQKEWINWLLILYSLVCVVVGSLFVYTSFTSEQGIENNVLVIYVGLIVAFSWLWNIVASTSR